MYFVYISYNGTPIGQKWEQMFINAETGKVYEHIKKIKLTEEETLLSISELKEKYPYPLNGE